MKKKRRSSLETVYIANASLLTVQKRRCWVCGAFMRKGTAEHHPLNMSRDHIRPVSKGGKNKHGNILYAHHECNSKRGNAQLDGKQALRARYYRIGALAFQLANY